MSENATTAWPTKTDPRKADPTRKDQRTAWRTQAQQAPVVSADDRRDATRTPEASSSSARKPYKGSAHAARIKVTQDGPYVVTGSVPLDEAVIKSVGGHHEYRPGRTFDLQSSYALCRCGKSSTPPFCDGSHHAAAFSGVETASRRAYRDRSDVYHGEGVTLFDDNRCAYARFCHRDDGDVWTLTTRSNDQRMKREAIIASSECPAGRLTHVGTRDAHVYEPDLAPGITLLQDPEEGVSGPLFVHGRITLEAEDGTTYELRNRYALCRCGESRDKPFCDAMHVHTGYSDRGTG